MSRGTVTPAQLRRLAGGARSKYGSRRTHVAELGRTFDSQREASAAVELLRRQQAGEVRGLRFQVRYSLDVNGVHVCAYVADFVYEERTILPFLPPWDVRWTVIVADAKGYQTDVYKLKRALMLACHGVRIVEL